MNPGLVWLIRRVPLQLWRRTTRRFKGVRGVLTGAAVAAFLLFALAPAVIESIVRPADPAVLAANARTFGPPALLLMTGLTLLAPANRKGGLYFRPHEVGLLFPAPISRRELLAYHVLSRAVVQLLSAAWVSVFIMRHAPTWYGCLVGAFLALVFLHLVSTLTGLATAAAGKRFAWPVRWGLFALVGAALAFGAVRALPELRLDGDVRSAMQTLGASPAVRIVTAPFQPFVRTFAGEGPLEVVTWAGASVVVIALTLLVLSWIDVAYEESAVAFSQEIGRKIERMRSGGGALAAMGPSKAAFRVPALPYLRGAGPIAWRQCIEITRHVKVIVVSLVLLLLWPVVIGGVIVAKKGADSETAREAVAAIVPMSVAFSVVFTQNIGFDFRRDLDRIAFLRSLPVAPAAVAAGQIAPSAVLLAILQTLVAAPALAWAGVVPAAVAPLLGVPLFVFSWCVIAADNLLFLHFPHRVDPDDASFMGRLMLVMFLKFAGLGVVLGFAGGLGVLTGYLLGGSIVAGVLVATMVLLVADIALTCAAGHAFGAFDPGRDAPE